MTRPVYIKLFSIMLITVVGAIVYSNTFLSSFHFDDYLFIVNNAAIKNIHDIRAIWNFLPCRFILYLSLALNYHCHQLHVLGYHLVNLIIHLASGIMVWWLVFLTLSTPVMKENKIAGHSGLVALLAGLVFVSHPLQTQAVTYIMQRSACLAALFYLASLCLYVKSRITVQSQIYYIISLAMAVFAMFTKENTITLPLMIVLYEFSFLKTKKNLHWPSVVPFLLTLGIIPATMLFAMSGHSFSSQEIHRALSERSSCWQYLLTQLRVIATYIRLLFIPLNQNLDYDYALSKSIFELPTLLSFLFLAGIIFLAQRLFAKYRLVSFSIFWFFLTLLPESSFLSSIDIIYEHRLYLPLVGYSMFLVSGLYYLWGKNNLKTMIIVLALSIGFNSVLTYQRNKIWKDEFTLWDDTILKSPHKPRPYINRGTAYASQGKVIQAMSDFNKALEISPDNANAYYNRSLEEYQQGRFAQSMSDSNKAIALNPDFAQAYANRGFKYAIQGRYTKAIADLDKAIELNPNVEEFYNDRGICWAKQGDFAKALSDFNQAIKLNPDYTEVYFNRAKTLADLHSKGIRH